MSAYNISSFGKTKVNGYYINNFGDTIKVIYSISSSLDGQEPLFEIIQKSITIIDSSKNKIKLFPSMASEIGFTYDGNKYILYSECFDCQSNDNYFLQRKIDGTLKLYTILNVKSNGGYTTTSAGGSVNYHGGGSTTTETYLLKKNNEDLVEFNNDFFKVNIKEYFKNCSYIIDRINNKTYKVKDIELLVKDFNINCGI